MAKEEKKEPDALEVLKQNYSKMNKILATTTSVHSEAYLAAQNKHLMEGKHINYELLDKKDVQKKFLDTMIDHYLERAVKELNLKEKPKDAMEQDRILEAYSNVTRGELERMIKENGREYTLNQHENVRDELMKTIRNKLSKSASSHVTKENMGAIIKGMELSDLVDIDKMDHEDAATLYGLYHQKGDKLTSSDIDHFYRQQTHKAPVFMKTMKKEGKYVTMDQYKKKAA